MLGPTYSNIQIAKLHNETLLANANRRRLARLTRRRPHERDAP